MICFRSMDAAEEPARSLLAATLAEYDEVYADHGEVDERDLPSATALEMAPPAGVFLVGYDGDRAVASGGLKRLDGDTAEIKRMYVVPPARGRGIGGLVLRALEDEARRLGYRRARLDTGARQPHARALYRSAGYVAVPRYNRNPFAAFWGEKDL